MHTKYIDARIVGWTRKSNRNFSRKRLCVFSNLALDFKRKADDLSHKATLSNGEKKIVKYLNKTILRWAHYTFLTNHRRVIKTPPLNNTMSLEILEQLAQNLCTNQNQPFQVPLYIQHSLFTRATQLFYTMLTAQCRFDKL